MKELCKSINSISQDWKSWRQRSFDFNGTMVLGESKLSKEEEMKYLYDTYETAKNDKVMGTLNDLCDKATKEFEEYRNSYLYKMCTPIWTSTMVLEIVGLLMFGIMLLNKTTNILLPISIPMILVAYVLSCVQSKIENKYKKLKYKMGEVYYQVSVVTMYYDFVSNRMKYLAELISKEKSKKSKRTNRVS